MQKKVTPVFGGKEVLIEDTEKLITPFGGIALLTHFFEKVGLGNACETAMPFTYSSPNAIPPAHSFLAFLLSVVSGARRFSHANMVRMDKGLHVLLGIKRFPTDDTIRNFFNRFNQNSVKSFFSKLNQWQLQRFLANRTTPLSLDLDSTVFERYGIQEGVRKGYNPRRPGRPSHHPILACLAEIPMMLNGWLRSGNASSSWAAHEFLGETLALLPGLHWIRMVRADSGFFEDLFLSFLEEWKLPYIVVAKMTKAVKAELCMTDTWKDLDETYSVASFQRKLHGWEVTRRFVVIRERVKENKEALGRTLFDVPGYTFRVFVTSSEAEPEEIWRDYNQRATIEQRIRELKDDLGMDDFCMRGFDATDAAFRSVLFLYNLLVEFQQAIKKAKLVTPATLRNTVFLCGAAIGRVGSRIVIRLSKAYGGLATRMSYFDNLSTTGVSMSPKLAIESG